MNDVMASGGYRKFCDDSTKALVLKSLKIRDDSTEAIIIVKCLKMREGV